MSAIDSSRKGEGQRRRYWGRYVRALVAPAAIWLLLVLGGTGPLLSWVEGQESYDQGALREWLEEARLPNQTLTELVDSYLQFIPRYLEVVQSQDPEVQAQLIAVRGQLLARRDVIYQHLRALGEPATKLFSGQLPLFPLVYRLEVDLDCRDLPAAGETELYATGPRLADPIVWDSGLVTEIRSAQETPFQIHPRAQVVVRYQLHAFDRRQRSEQEHARRRRWLTILGVAVAALGLAWLVLVQGHEREQERQRLLTRERIEHAERLRAEAERELLRQRMETQAAERQALEWKSHLYASMGIMAGSYAHNIKNLLVRPNDLLRRCLESRELPAEQQQMLREVQQTLGTVTERLQQILQTVRRDPSCTEMAPLDLAVVLRGMMHTWREMAQDRWKLDIELELGPQEGGLWVQGDASHLQQAIENLLFNARDATFEMRNQVRKAARQGPQDEKALRQALITAAGWRGRVVVRAWKQPPQETGGTEEVVVEVRDNGIGMSKEVLLRCTETYFSTKRDNALFEGNTTGMGLGLSFVVTVLEHHHAHLEVDSEPSQGATFRMRLPASAR
jgi:signal transduction histidine kinase